jgi:hypothetical protein
MRRRSALAGSALAVVALSGCAVERPSTNGGSVTSGVSPAVSSREPLAGDAATWSLAPEELLDPKTTFLVVEVTRLGCASGITGTVLDPQIHYDETQVLLRTDVEKIGPGAHECQGNDAVPVEIHLDQPLGVRELVDAACLQGEAVGTAACTEAVRWAPPAGLTRHDGVPDWQPPPDYSFVVQSSCGEQAFIGEYAVRVEQGAVASVDPLRRGFDETGVDSVPSLTAMLDLARQAEREGAAEVWVDQDGVPRWFDLDLRLDSIDDENCFLITHYEEH